MKCDFCCDPNVKPVWLFKLPVRQMFGIATDNHVTVMDSSTEWLACDECAMLIKLKNKKSLLTRSLLSLVNQHNYIQSDPMLIEGAKNSIKIAHDAFFSVYDNLPPVKYYANSKLN